MSAQHTPGPWSHRNGRIFQTDRPELTIANVARAHDGDYSAVNGDLLAAAPEMLDALLDIVRRNEIQNWFNVDKARAAIAKATGGAA